MRLWQLVACATWEIVLADRDRHFGSLAVSKGVVRTHDPLQLGKFPDHCRQKITLAQFRGPLGFGALLVAERRDLAGERAYASRLIADRAEFHMESDLIERFPQ